MLGCHDEDCCTCSCHDNPDEMHIAPCCHTCIKCGKDRLTDLQYERHVQTCDADPEMVQAAATLQELLNS